MAEEQTRKEIAEIVTELVTASLSKIVPLIEGQRRRLGYNCTGNSFGCDTFYICDNNNHSCKTGSSFSCGGQFDCTGGAFGIVVERL
jgi:hypothetical protein